jgi:uncharacterized membrane protein YdjX (TVP38/TMEM64 family)
VVAHPIIPYECELRTVLRDACRNEMLFRVGEFAVTWKKVGWGLAIIVGCAIPAVLGRSIDIGSLRRTAEGLDGIVVFGALVALPLGGFPATVMHVVAGARFGWGLGALLIGASILLQLLLSYWLVRLAPGFFKRRLEPVRGRIPRGAHSSVTLFTMLLPGVPYFVQNYVLAMIGVPLWTYLAVCLPIHWARSLVSLTFGHWIDDLTPMRIGGFLLYNLMIIVACSLAFRRLRARLKGQPPTANGRKRLASARSVAR